MRSLMLIAMVAISTTAFAETRNSKFEAYQERLAQRRAKALELRRQYNLSKGPAIVRTSTLRIGVIPRYIGIEAGWVRQPPVPMRPVFAVPYSAAYIHTGRSLNYVVRPTTRVHTFANN